MIFLRPWFLVLLLMLPLFYYGQKKFLISSSWKKFIKPEFIPFLMVTSNQTKQKKHTLLWISLLWSLLTIALAGPAWEKIQAETSTHIKGTVLIADLNSVNQTTLPQLKIKLSETLKSLKGEQVALVLYDKQGYTALPLTADFQIIQEMIPALNPNVLPDIGNHPEEGFKKAIELFKNADLNTGRILFFTGGVPSTEKVIDVLKDSSFTVGTLGLGSEKKAPILSTNGTFQRDENGNPILIAPDESSLKKIGAFTFWTPDNQDINYLLKQTKTTDVNNIFNQTKDDFFKVDTYKDMGIYLLLILMPFTALFFRKGLFFLFFICFFSYNASASIWLRDDQILHKTNQRAVQAYQNKDYLSALAGFKKDSSQTGLYNQGNAQAHMGQIKEAINLYSEVLKQNPNHKEAAFNKAYLENLMKEKNKEQEKQNQNEKSSPENQNDKQSEQQNEQQHNGNTDKENQQNNKDTNEDSQSKSNPEQSNKDASSLENKTEQKNEAQNPSSTNESEQVYPPKENQNESSKNNKQSQEKKNNQSGEEEFLPSYNEDKQPTEFDQETQEIFNKLKKDPSRLLRYRLYEQKRRAS